MRLSRVYTSQLLQAPDIVELATASSHYLSRVLRLSKGDPVILFNGDGWDYSGEIFGIQRQCVSVKLADRSFPNNESALKITLVQAITRGERMDYSLQKATELGVFSIQPISCHRVDVRLDQKRQAKRLAHWQGVVISACEQSGRAYVPELYKPVSFSECMTSVDETPRLILDPTAKNSISSYAVAGDAVSIIIGPEGGFTDKEMQEALVSDVTPVSLGPRILRTETAGPAAIAVLQANSGNL